MAPSATFITLLLLVATGFILLGSSDARRLDGKGEGKGGGRNTMMTNKSKSKSKSKGKGSSIHDVKPAELVCLMFEAHDHLGRRENNDPNVPGMPWDSVCDDLEGFDPYLCPTKGTLAF